jgi:hypothetical protein
MNIGVNRGCGDRMNREERRGEEREAGEEREKRRAQS